MMRNSIGRQVELIVGALRDEIAPALEDPYLRAQALAAAELVANLGTRVEYRQADLVATTDRILTVLVAATAIADASVLPRAWAALAAARTDDDRHHAAALEALGEVQTWVVTAAAEPEVSELRRQIREFLVWQLEAEAPRMRAVMYRSARAVEDTDS